MQYIQYAVKSWKQKIRLNNVGGILSMMGMKVKPSALR